MEVSKLSSIGRKLFDVIEFDQNETLLYEIRKHPFGLLTIYLTGFSVAAVLFLLLVVGPVYLPATALEGTIDMTTIRVILAVIGGLLSILAIVMTAISAYLYQSNVVLVTSEKIAQVLYRTIFDRKISQLSIGDVQDVTVVQKGIFARMLNFGTLTVETAGEQQNYHFTYTPDPYKAAKALVGSHEDNLHRYGN